MKDPYMDRAHLFLELGLAIVFLETTIRNFWLWRLDEARKTHLVNPYKTT
jgi:hypothetical protein